MRHPQHFITTALSLFLATVAARADGGASLSDGSIIPEKPVMFLPGAATMPSSSQAGLESVAAYLAAHPEIGAIRVEAYAGTPATEKAAVKLSTQRASTVAAVLVKAGVDRKRVTSVGLGPRRPVAPWALPGAEAVNERLIFRITATDGKPVVFPVAILRSGVGAAINANGADWKEANGLQPLMSGSVLGTREDGNAWVDVPGRAWLRLGAGVALRLEGDTGPDAADKPLSLQVGAGSLAVDARPSTAPVQLQVGGSFVANIAGTSVHALLRADGSAQVRNLGGAPLKFTAAAGKRVTLAPGQALVMEANGTVSAPTPILAQPTWKDAPTEEIRALAVTGPAVLPSLSVNPVDGAKAWRALVVPYQGGTAVQSDLSPAADTLPLLAEGGRYAVAVQALDADGLPGMLSGWLPVTVRAAPFARAAMGPGGVIQVASGHRMDWTGGLQCNGESFTDFKVPGEKTLTCTDDEGNLYAPLKVATLAWRATVVSGQGDLTAGKQQDVTVEVACDAPLPATLTGEVTGAAKARSARQQRPGGALAKVVAFHLDLDPVEAGTATFTATTGLLEAPPVSVTFNIVAPPPPPPPPPPPVVVAPPPPKKVEPTGPQAWGWKCLVDPRSWCVPAGLSAVTMAGAVTAGVVALGGVGLWALATNLKMDLVVGKQTFLNVGTVAAAVGLVALAGATLLAATAVGNAGTALMQQ